jgi:four helix bundle protein
MTNKAPNLNDQTNRRRSYDLCERTAVFGEAVITFVKRIPMNPITSPLISQVVRSATSIGANYCEADEAESRKEFRYRVAICKRESRETKHNLRMLVAAEPNCREQARLLWQEAKELTLIFAAILRPK